MSITKESKEWLAVLERFGLWKSGQMILSHGKGWHEDTQPPDITPDLLYAIRRAIEARGWRWDLQCTDQGERLFYSMILYKGGQDKIVTPWCDIEDDATIRAAASLQEAESGS